MDGPLLLPALRKESAGLRTVDGVAVAAATILSTAAALAYLWRQNADWPEVCHVAVVVAAPAWVIARLWPQVVQLSGDPVVRDELHLAGLTTSHYLWSAMRRPLWAALRIPLLIWLVPAAASLAFETQMEVEYTGKSLLAAAMTMLRSGNVMAMTNQFIVAFTSIVLGAAAAAQVLGMMLRGVSRGRAAVEGVLAAICIPVAVILLWRLPWYNVPAVMVWAGCCLFGAPLLLGSGAGRLVARAARAVCAARPPVRVAVVTLVIAAVAFAPGAYLTVDTYARGWQRTELRRLMLILPVFLTGLVLLGNRAMFAARAWRDGADG